MVKALKYSIDQADVIVLGVSQGVCNFRQFS